MKEYPIEIINECSALLKNFGDPTRIRILLALNEEKEMSVSSLTEKLKMSQSAVSHQLATLKSARLVKTKRKGQSIFYSIADDHVQEIVMIGMEHVLETYGGE